MCTLFGTDDENKTPVPIQGHHHYRKIFSGVPMKGILEFIWRPNFELPIRARTGAKATFRYQIRSLNILLEKKSLDLPSPLHRQNSNKTHVR